MYDDSENDTFLVEKRENDHPTVFRRSTTIFYEENSDDDSTMKKNPTFFERKQYLIKSLVFGIIFCYFYLSFGSSDHPRYIGTIQLTGFPPFF